MERILGMALGLVFATGVLLIMKFLTSRKIKLKQRISPYLVEADPHARLMGPQPGGTPLDVLEKLIFPWFDTLSRALARLGSTNTQVTRKLALAGRDVSVERFRLEQIAWASGGLILGIVMATGLVFGRDGNPLALFTLVGITTLTGPLLSEYLLTAQSKARTQRLLMEFPTIAELLALAVSAGESPLGALERVSSTSSGALAAELDYTLRQVRSGTAIQVALHQLGQRTEVPTIIRFADSIAVAIERGTPLTTVLQSQAQDARDAGHRELMEIGGSKELRMLFPVVFLILPITVVFAAFPSIIAFNVTF